MATPPDAYALMGLVLLLGLKHGFDPDHLVAIDGLTRASPGGAPRIVRLAGLFFSLGHGVVVTLVALTVAVLAHDWQAPPWLEYVGALISIGVLTVLGIANMLAAARTRPDAAVSLVALKSRWLISRRATGGHPLLIAAIGAAFALSFDTVSHALFFSLTGASMAGWWFAAALGGIFTLGMVATDTLNGLWVARVLVGADRRAAVASRCMSRAIALLSFALAAVGCVKYVAPGVHAADWSAAASIGVIVIIIAAYVLARRLAAAEPSG